LFSSFPYGLPFVIQEYAMAESQPQVAFQRSAEIDRTLAENGNRQSLESAGRRAA
jgi:hypothetical protein